MVQGLETSAIVSLTPMAIDKVKGILEQEDSPGLGLRVFVRGGGCSGLSYGMALDERAEDDLIAEHAGVVVLIDPMSAMYLGGAEIDYQDSLMGGGFSVNNPNAVSTCGCGHSFQTSDHAGTAKSCGCG
ncbi:MAG: iron-sulfur cluster insertion protein ErpA [Chloroflexi bacterium]|nr:iron-sulfur cluster insertion protein ErpA [Chloroflexota bacterium]